MHCTPFYCPVTCLNCPSCCVRKYVHGFTEQPIVINKWEITKVLSSYVYAQFFPIWFPEKSLLQPFVPRSFKDIQSLYSRSCDFIRLHCLKCFPSHSLPVPTGYQIPRPYCVSHYHNCYFRGRTKLRRITRPL